MTQFPSIGVSRHRIGSDGVGVTTLVAAHGCPLNCRYCLNPQCQKGAPPQSYTLESLYEKVVCDDIYFEATGGGITFGGGEPLLYAEFIRNFISLVKERGRLWRFNLETSLAVPLESLCLLDGMIDEYIVDIKDMNSGIYLAYTHRSNDMTLAGLSHLVKYADKVRIRTPLIPRYNNKSDVDASHERLRKMGFTQLERFVYLTDVKK